MADILVVDDEIGIRELLSEILGDEGHTVLTADCAQSARRLRDDNAFDLVLLDIWMPDTDGVTLLREWAYRRPYSSSARRTAALRPYLRFYNHRRPHTSLGRRSPWMRFQEAA